MICVDWCDAYAYCRGVGKHLCTQIANDGGAPFDEWHEACSSGGQNVYPYGDEYSKTACNGPEAHNEGTVPVGSMPECQSTVPGYEGVYDLSGNVSEWVDDTCPWGYPRNIFCGARGGSYYAFTNTLPCNGTDISSIEAYGPSGGLRCCSQ